MREAQAKVLWKAIVEGNVEDVKSFFDGEVDPAIIDYAHNYGNTVLHLAAQKIWNIVSNNPKNADTNRITNLEKIVKILLDNGANPLVRNIFNDTPLHWAAASGNTTIAKLLITQRIKNVNARNEERRTPGETFTIECINLDDRNSLEETPLHWAASNGHEAMVVTLMGYNVNVNAQNNTGETPLDCAICCNHEDVALLLIAKRAVANTQKDSTKLANLLKMGVTVLHPDFKQEISKESMQAPPIVTQDNGNSIEKDNFKEKEPTGNIQPSTDWDILNFLSNYPVASILILASAAFSTLYFSNYGGSIIENLGSFCKVCMSSQKLEINNLGTQFIQKT
ncbi:MAG: hypothetical protein K0R73_937 [Candidatus Midichloriaceae bacterium]|jgi:hypothetical protein|nr:hypothetical protein [Candidatus Midichloriaceae bacterium]